LYIADTTGNKIWRMGTTLPAPASPAASCGATPVYDASSSTCTSGGNATTCPTGPEGPSFLRVNTIDLYFNTHGTNTGVWKIAGIASASSNCGTNCPVAQVVPTFGASASGEGTEFDIFGNLLAVDSADNQVLRATAPAFSSTQPFITTNLSSPFGVALNTCGDILVASGKYVNRYNSSNGAFIDRLTVGGNNYPRFLEVDAANRIFLTTAADETGKNATIWRFDPANAGTNNAVTSCALPSYTLVWTQALSTKTNLGLLGNNALGLGLAPSTFAISQTLSAANNYSATFNFGGQHSFSVTCTNPTGVSIPMTVTALRSRPTDSTSPEVTFSPANPWPAATTTQCPALINTPVCTHYGSLHGFCTQYVETTVPADPSTVCGNFQFKIGFFSAEFFSTPGGAHTSGTNATDPFTDCQSQDFYATAGPGLDTGTRLDGSNSKHVVFNSGLTFQNTVLTLTSPVSSCGTSGNCNPQFNAGQNIAVKFNLSFANGTAISTATEQLSVILVQTTFKGVTTTVMQPQTVVSTKNSSTLNFFNANSSGQYSYNLDSSAFTQLKKGTLATYQFNIWGNGFQPYMFPVNVQY
ncbi:MAG TPA: hypothetical protein VF786_04045, partial [Terriglobales bacterium]